MAIPTVLKIGGSLLSQTDWPSRLNHWLQTQPAGLYFTIVGGGEAIEAMRELDRIHTLDQTAMHWRCIDMLEATFEVAVELLERVIPNLKTVRTSKSLCSIDSSAGQMKSEPMALATGFDIATFCPIAPEASAYGSGKMPFSPPHPSADGQQQERAELVLVTVPSFYNSDSYESDPNRMLGRGNLLPQIGWQTTSDTLAMFLASVIQSNRCVLFKSCSVESFATLEDAVAAGVADSQVLQYAASGIRCELITL
ncbi:MAG: hypothetical protein NTW52_08650 [Planctomycetota bacterium]|nr:hypothetical protein [Planctomycetota bacterium]